MLMDFLQDRAALYVSGALTAPERKDFELVLEFHEELRAWVAGLQEAMAIAVVAESARAEEPSAALRTRVMDSLSPRPRPVEPIALVVTDAQGLTRWINPAFTAMCGYSLAELAGQKPGHRLQGPDTDREALGRIREAVRAGRSCRETLINYHKDGSRYAADIEITPILDDGAQPVWFVARERLVTTE